MLGYWLNTNLYIIALCQFVFNKTYFFPWDKIEIIKLKHVLGSVFQSFILFNVFIKL